MNTIEQILRHELGRECLVLLWDEAKQWRLLKFVAAHTGQEPNQGELKRWLEDPQSLPLEVAELLPRIVASAASEGWHEQRNGEGILFETPSAEATVATETFARTLKVRDYIQEARLRSTTMDLILVLRDPAARDDHSSQDAGGLQAFDAWLEEQGGMPGEIRLADYPCRIHCTPDWASPFRAGEAEWWERAQEQALRVLIQAAECVRYSQEGFGPEARRERDEGVLIGFLTSRLADLAKESLGDALYSAPIIPCLLTILDATRENQILPKGLKADWEFGVRMWGTLVKTHEASQRRDLERTLAEQSLPEPKLLEYWTSRLNGLGRQWERVCQAHQTEALAARGIIHALGELMLREVRNGVNKADKPERV